MTSKPIKPGDLRAFVPFAHLGAEQIIPLADSIELRRAAAGECLLKIGSRTDHALFLVAGSVELEGRDGHKFRIQAGDKSAREAIAALRPCQYQVCAGGPALYFLLPQQLIDALSRQAPRDDYQAGNETLEMGAKRHPVFLDFRRDLKENRLQLPSLPDVALKIRKAINNSATDAAQIARIVNLDPAMSVKLIHVANSPLYRGSAEITSTEMAITRLGLHTTRELVLCFSMRDLFEAKSILIRERLREVWMHALDVAAICHVLAGLCKGYHPDTALLAGLIHNIGVLPILNHIDRYYMGDIEREELDEILTSLRAEVGTTVLARWGFPEELVRVPAHAYDWHYDSGAQPDYADLVILAQLHNLMGTGSATDLPSIDSLPVYDKFSFGPLTPQLSIRILDDAREKIEQVRQLLS